MPAKIAFAGENTWKTDIRAKVAKKNHSHIYEADALAQGRRKHVEDVDGGDEPL
jgi:hypothetical protein